MFTNFCRQRQNATSHSSSTPANSFVPPPQPAAAPTTTPTPLNYMQQPQFNIPQQQMPLIGMHPGIVPSAFLAQQQQLARDQRVPVQIYLAQQIAMQNVMEQVYMQYLNQYMHLWVFNNSCDIILFSINILWRFFAGLAMLFTHFIEIRLPTVLILLISFCIFLQFNLNLTDDFVRVFILWLVWKKFH